MKKSPKKVSTDRKLCFRALGGPHDGENLFMPPPFPWDAKSFVLESQIGDGTYHQYCFSRIDWTATYEGVVVAKAQGA